MEIPLGPRLLFSQLNQLQPMVSANVVTPTKEPREAVLAMTNLAFAPGRGVAVHENPPIWKLAGLNFNKTNLKFSKYDAKCP